jgi:hypothetical protein
LHKLDKGAKLLAVGTGNSQITNTGHYNATAGVTPAHEPLDCGFVGNIKQITNEDAEMDHNILLTASRIMEDNPSFDMLVVNHAPRMPTPGKRIKYAAKKRNQKKRF